MNNNEVNNSTEATEESFWSILSQKKYTICIPRIQRDYAQGRIGPEAEQIRLHFLNDIFFALENDNPLDINFIYGNIDENKKGEKRFIPIDGQQRLTTLFLLHWYFISLANQLTPENKSVLNRFQYETRFTTGDFCSRLVNDVHIDLRELVLEKKDLISVIKDYYWFFNTYDSDASIKAMLVMLGDIHKKVCNLKNLDNIDCFFEKLTTKSCPIHFLFLNISDFGLTDEIYLKMNARGKALTEFENFKAQLSSYLSVTDPSFSQKFIENINGVWSQFFWHEEYRANIKSKDNKDTKSIIFDDQIMNLFRFIMMNEYVSNVKIDDGTSKTKYLIRNVISSLNRESNFLFFNHLFSDNFSLVLDYDSGSSNVNINVFHFINKLLNVLAKKRRDSGNLRFVDSTLYDKQYINEDTCFQRVIRSTNEKNLSYDEQILFYAEMCFLVKFSNDDYSFDKNRELTEWIRYVYNLTSNMLYNAGDDYARSIRRVRAIVDSGDALNILQYASRLLKRTYKQGSGYGFVDNQMMEESIKANLLQRGEHWRELICLSEKSFLGSQIAAILSFSGIWNKYESDIIDFEKQHVGDGVEVLNHYNEVLFDLDKDSSYQDNFFNYLTKFNMIFDQNSIKPNLEENSLLRRALLTFGDDDSYMLPEGKTISCFLDVTDRDTSFKRLFRGDSKKKRQYFKELLDSISIDEDVESQLTGIINSCTFTTKNEWKRYFIEMPELLDCMYQNKDKTDPSRNYVFRNAKRFIYKNDDNQRILLLEKTMTTSINREYYSYVLYLKAVKSGLSNIKYFTTFGETSDKYVIFTNKHGQDVQVVYAKVGENGYKFIAKKNGNEDLFYGDINSMLDYIQQQCG